MSLNLSSPSETLLGVRDRMKRRRLVINLTQTGLASRSGVTLPSLRRFERTGLIAFEALLKLALVLECLADFDRVASDDGGQLRDQTLDQILREKAPRKKGRLK